MNRTGVLLAAVVLFCVGFVAAEPGAAGRAVKTCATTTVRVTTTVVSTVTQTVTATTATAPTTTVSNDPSYPVRGVYDRDTSPSGFDDEKAAGFNVIDSGPYADQLSAEAAAGVKGMIWLGGYSNTTCSFNQTDAWVTSHVSAIVGNPGVGYYFIDDEPNVASCPSAPQQMQARSDLVKSVDPAAVTFLVTYHVDQLAALKGTVDIIGLDHYPCTYAHGCDYSVVDDEAAAADRLGIRYWGVVQAFGDDASTGGWYRLPTADELHQEFVHWRATRMEGYLVYAWRQPSDDPSMWLANHPDLLAQVKIENAA